MKKINQAVLFSGIVFFGLLVNPGKSTAGVSVNIGLALPFPQVMFAAPPFLHSIPGTGVFYAPAHEINTFYYSGGWYRPRGQNWYRATTHNGPWVLIAPPGLPLVFKKLPGTYYDSAPERYRGYYRGDDNHYKRHWRDRRHGYNRWQDHNHRDGRGQRYND